MIKRNRLLYNLVAVLIVLCLMPGCTPPPDASSTKDGSLSEPRNIPVDWDMTAYLVEVDGKIAETIPMAVNGFIQEGETRDQFSLQIHWPEDFRYKYITPDNGIDTSVNVHIDDPNDFILSTATFDRKTTQFKSVQFLINTELEYFLGYWGEEFGLYLVACTDPDVSPADILDHFQAFLEKDG